ncbi:alpha/beta fold hydrolase [Cohnella faecalis]|uniref:Alpha/beta hydrolase n=1 Tax=Cohnella faecalis TaxID=2315694 RepID=A0A398CJW4_9BACL|nr:alpha/beta hydrolase [Cohnella faecalis]RIE02993.1 alpha/beta hydrolase [Cohnella faecalis]
MEPIVKSISCKQTPITYYIWGNSNADTLLLLHPAFADHTIFEPQTAFFQNRFRVIALDMPGHGECRTKGAQATLGDMPDILDRILADNRISSCHLIGVSLGSLVAQAFADRYPRAVRTVTAVGGYSIHKANDAILKEQRKEGWRWLLYLLFSMKKFRKHVVSVSCSTAEGRAAFARGIERFGRKSFLAMAGMNAFFVKKDSPVPYPLLILTGEHDRQLAHDAAAELHRMEPLSEKITLPRAGHCANADAPYEFNTIVEKFLLANRANI